MRRDAQFGVLVHVAGADLDLQRLVVRSDHRGVDRAVLIVLGRGDVVVELAGQIAPQAVHHAERRVAVGDRLDHDAHRAHVVELLEGELLALHFSPDAVDMLRATVDLRADARRRQLGLQLGADLIDVLFARHAPLDQRGGDVAGTRPARAGGRPGPPAPT